MRFKYLFFSQRPSWFVAKNLFEKQCFCGFDRTLVFQANFASHSELFTIQLNSIQIYLSFAYPVFIMSNCGKFCMKRYLTIEKKNIYKAKNRKNLNGFLQQSSKCFKNVYVYPRK